MILIHLNNHNFGYVKHNVWKDAMLLYINIVKRNAFLGAQKHCISLSITSNIQARIQKAYKIEILTVKQTQL